MNNRSLKEKFDDLSSEVKIALYGVFFLLGTILSCIYLKCIGYVLGYFLEIDFVVITVDEYIGWYAPGIFILVACSVMTVFSLIVYILTVVARLRKKSNIKREV